MDGQVIIRRVLGWALFWYTTYRFAKRLNGSKCPEYSCRIITEIHAIIITVLTCWILFFTGTWPFDVLGLKNQPVEIETICASLGYFLHDFIWCLYYMTEGPAMLFHHFMSILTMTCSLWMGVSAVEVMGTIFGSEISSIFLNLRWFIKFHKLHDTTFGIIVDIVFVLTFIGVRMFVGGYLTYRELFSPAPLLMKIGGSCMYGVNCVFLVHILSFARYRIKKLSRKSDKMPIENMNGHTKPLRNMEQNGLRHRVNDGKNTESF